MTKKLRKQEPKPLQETAQGNEALFRGVKEQALEAGAGAGIIVWYMQRSLANNKDLLSARSTGCPVCHIARPGSVLLLIDNTVLEKPEMF